jgi:hypothetical protein
MAAVLGTEVRIDEEAYKIIGGAAKWSGRPDSS